MTRMLLAISEATADTALREGTYEEIFLWTHRGRSTFTGTVDPYLSELGMVNPRNVDLVRIALGVLAADRSVLRAARGSSWNARKIELTVQVGDPDVWVSHADQLTRIVGFLSGDYWVFRFTAAPSPEATVLPLDEQHHDRTCC